MNCTAETRSAGTICTDGTWIRAIAKRSRIPKAHHRQAQLLEQRAHLRKSKTVKANLPSNRSLHDPWNSNWPPTGLLILPFVLQGWPAGVILVRIHGLCAKLAENWSALAHCVERALL